ncbi:MAG TPA: BrnT family toxin [Rhizomicrobium sp.]|nr:BrnT family toxin [Rhizomicrobium sp.]
MAYEWDEAKRAANLRKHGIDFADMEEFDWSTAIYDTDESADGEDRFMAIGLLGGRVHVVIFTFCGEITRIISARKAERKEVRRYEKETY